MGDYRAVRTWIANFVEDGVRVVFEIDLLPNKKSARAKGTVTAP
jgi:hypothetical protein